MSCIVRKFGHSSKKKLQREIFDVSVLLKKSKKSVTSLSTNLVINNPIFLIGGEQQPYDQGQLGSCTANALAFAFVVNAVKQKFVPFMPSRLDIYYNERYHMGGSQELTLDEGTNISDAAYVLENIGVIPEKSWPYMDDSSNLSYYTVPQNAQDDIRTLALTPNSMYSVNPEDLNAIKLVLTNGYPLVAGIIVDTDIFCSEQVACTGIVTKIPNLERGNLAGHAVVIIGYTTDGYFLIRNSWGVNWGLGFLNQSTGIYNYDEYEGKMRGYFKVPFCYITNPNITTELYAVTEIHDTSNTIHNTQYTLNPSLDTFFSLESIIKPIGTFFATLNAANAKLRVDVFYAFDNSTNMYVWHLKSIRTIGNTDQIVSECEITNLNYIDKIQVGFYNKSKLISSYVTGSSIAIGRNNKIADVLSINTSTGKLSIISRINV